MTLHTLLVEHPDVFWPLVYACWGGAYAAILISVGAMALLTHHWMANFPQRRLILAFCQWVWTITHLGGVFLIPGLLGAFAPTELRESRFMPLAMITCLIGVASIYPLVRPFWGTLSGKLARDSDQKGRV